MCPERQIISLYHDGELPSPWKEKMDSHFETCPECRAILDGYGSFAERGDGLNDENIMAASERVWKNLTSPELLVSRDSRQNLSKRPSQSYTNRRVWQKSVTVPVPAAAAAAIVIIVALFAVFGLTGRSDQREPMAVIPDYVHIVENEPGMVPVTDMSGVLQYLSSFDNGDFMVIRLPETKNFVRTGEPALINAADYSRRRATR